MTVPLGTVELACWVTDPTISPAWVMALVAALWVRPTTLGTVTGAGSEDTTRSTAEPGATEAPAAGFWRMTVPLGTVELACWVTDPTISPAWVMALVAALWVRPTTLGTVTGAGSEDTTRSTAEPGATEAPAAGFWLMTVPLGAVVLACWITDPTVSPAATMALAAALWVRPTTSGTLMAAGPE